MRVIDLNTSTFGAIEPGKAAKLRAAADRAGCVVTNLKMNQRELDMTGSDAAERATALREYKRCIDAAAELGARWVRPIPRKQKPDLSLAVTGYRELIEYGAPKGVSLLVENFGWMQSEPEAAAQLMDAIGEGVAASPDTGNWVNDEVRYAGLARMFPRAVTCDFKARELGPNGEHKAYDLQRCFQAGWEAGFRGPWCLEHAQEDWATLKRNLAFLRDSLRAWMKAASSR